MITRKASVPFIFATIFLDSLGIGIIMPILPDLLRRFSTDIGFVSKYLGFFISSYALMQFIFSPILGTLSDRFGRRPILLASLFGAAFDYLIMAFAPNLLILFIGRVIAGMTGASFTVATAYMADISDDTNRSANFGMIGAAFGLGFIVGPALGGIIGHYGASTPFIAAAVLNLLNFAFGYFVLPESLATENRRRVEVRKMNPFSSLAKAFTTPGIAMFVWVYILLYLAGNVHPSVWTLYSELKFGWTPLQVGLSLACVGVTMALVQGWLIRIVMPMWGESKALVIGCLIETVSFIAFALATEGWMIYAIIIPGALAGIAGPAIQSIITKQTPADRQGEMQGSLVGLASITAIVAPLGYTMVFAKFSRPDAPLVFLGMPYMIAAAIAASSLIFLYAGRATTK